MARSIFRYHHCFSRGHEYWNGHFIGRSFWLVKICSDKRKTWFHSNHTWIFRHIRTIPIGICNSCCIWTSTWRCFYCNHRDYDDYICIRFTWIRSNILHDWEYSVGVVGACIHLDDAYGIFSVLYVRKICTKNEFFKTSTSTINTWADIQRCSQ